MNEQMFKDIHNWEKEYLSMNNDLNKRQKELLEGAAIKSHEGMVSVSYTHLTLPTNREV